MLIRMYYVCIRKFLVVTEKNRAEEKNSVPITKYCVRIEYLARTGDYPSTLHFGKVEKIFRDLNF